MNNAIISGITLCAHFTQPEKTVAAERALNQGATIALALGFKL